MLGQIDSNIRRPHQVSTSISQEQTKDWKNIARSSESWILMMQTDSRVRIGC